MVLQIFLLLHCVATLAAENDSGSTLIEKQTANSTNTSLISRPGDSYVSSPNVYSLFVWKIHSTSPDGLRLDCRCGDGMPIETNSTHIPPLVNLTVTLQNEDNVTCKVWNGEKLLNTVNINERGGKKTTIIIAAITSTLAVIFLITTVILSIGVGHNSWRQKKSKSSPKAKPDVTFTNMGAGEDGGTTADVIEDEDYYADNIITEPGVDGLEVEEDYYTDNIITEMQRSKPGALNRTESERIYENGDY